MSIVISYLLAVMVIFGLIGYFLAITFVEPPYRLAAICVSATIGLIVGLLSIKT